MNWKLFDEMFASFARPFSMYVGTLAVAASCFGENGAIAIPAAALLAGGGVVMRSVDKGIAAKAATEDKKTAMVGGPIAPIKSEEVA